MSAQPQQHDQRDAQPDEQPRSLYRRHRPRTFADVVGQEPVVRTLRNAVQRGNVHHAYLFVGSRGTGKTSMAKILAACLNCQNGPTIEPCGRCQSCLSIASATSLDVIEMDAASNNSVDDIRDLRDSVAYAPVSGRRKVYILDEAHMLSTAAWNAFLKTLEEPPPNTVFVLATTEAGKVPATVVDRCHRFDFQRPTVEQIASVVRRTAQAESIDIPPAAVAALARSATGSFRDALGTLEQLVTYSGSTIELDDVLAVLGVADSSLLQEAIDAVAAGDAARALRTLEQCSAQGRDAGSFASDLEVRARELLVVQVLREVPHELSLTADADAALAAQAARVDHATVVRLLELLGHAIEAVRAGADARTRLELALVKAATPHTDGSTRALLARIERLERSIAPAPSQSPTPAASQPSQQPQQHAAAAPHAHATAPEPEPGPEPTPEPQAAAAPEPQAAAAPEQQAPGAHAHDLQSLCELWPAVVELVKGENGENGLLAACLVEARPVVVDGHELTVAYPPSAEFHKKKAETPTSRTAVGDALHALTGVRWRLSYELRDELDEADTGQTGQRSEEEWVARFMREFDAQELTDGAVTDEAVTDEGVTDEAVTSNQKGA